MTAISSSYTAENIQVLEGRLADPEDFRQIPVGVGTGGGASAPVYSGLTM